MQQVAFHNINIVDMIRQLSPEEKIEIRDLLDKALIEERRREIRRNCLAGEKEYRQGRVKFTGDTKKLMEMLK
jgi:hypothetical protein